MESYLVYIIYSASANKYFIGETNSIESRLTQHNQYSFKDSFTKQASDWKIFLLINCNSRKQARAIESQIKKMKSRKYTENLKNYPEIINKLKNKFLA